MISISSKILTEEVVNRFSPKKKRKKENSLSFFGSLLNMKISGVEVLIG